MTTAPIGSMRGATRLLPAGPFATLARRLGTAWWVLVVVGAAWIAVGFVVLRFDESTPAVVSTVFGVVVLLAAVGEVLQASVTTGGWRVWHVIFAALLVVAAVLTFARPAETFVSLALFVGFYFVFAGTYDVIAGLFAIEVTPAWWLGMLSGIAQIVLGYLASRSFESSVVVLVTWVAVSAIFRGTSEITAGFAVRSLASARRDG